MSTSSDDRTPLHAAMDRRAVPRRPQGGRRPKAFARPCLFAQECGGRGYRRCPHQRRGTPHRKPYSQAVGAIRACGLAGFGRRTLVPTQFCANASGQGQRDWCRGAIGSKARGRQMFPPQTRLRSKTPWCRNQSQVDHLVFRSGEEPRTSNTERVRWLHHW